MTGKYIIYWIIAFVTSLSSCAVLSAQESNCAEIDAMVGMARAKSTPVLLTWNQKAGDSYRAKVVFAFRFFELHPTVPRAASAILDLIPQNEKQDYVWHSFGSGNLCPNESFKEEMVPLDAIQSRFPLDLSKAILLVPDKMLAYVSYANMSGGSPSSDYAVQMQRVCRAKHREFVKAVDQLPPDAKKWFLSSTFNPDGCHALHFPEQ
jgi:hypothetical protein